MSPTTDIPPADGLTLTQCEILGRLAWFTQVRWVMSLGALALLLGASRLLGVEFRFDGRASLVPAIVVVCSIFAYNVAFILLTRYTRRRPDLGAEQIRLIALGQIICDLAAVTALVHYTGGVENFFIILALLPIALAGELLPQRWAYAVAGGLIVLLNAMLWGEQQGIVPHVHAVWPGGAVGRGLYADPRFVLEVSVALSATIFATAVITSDVARRLRGREREVEDAYHRLREADETKSFFMRKAGHEMRAPLAAITSILDTLPAADAEARRRLLGRAHKRAEGLMSLVDDLRRYSRLQAGGEAVERRPLELDALVRETVELFARQAEDAELTLNCRTDPARVRGDEEMLRQVVTNLVANAIQYTPPGGKVDLELRREGRQAVLEVRDTGIGIDPNQAERVFEDFWRSNKARQQFAEGTGLGLAICRRIVEMHDGAITAAPREGEGTAFTVTLPAAGTPAT